MKLLFRNHF